MASGTIIIVIMIILISIFLLLSFIKVDVSVVYLVYNNTNSIMYGYPYWNAYLFSLRTTEYQYLTSNHNNISLQTPPPPSFSVLTMTITNSEGSEIWMGNYLIQAGKNYTIFTNQSLTSGDTLILNTGQEHIGVKIG